MATKYLKNSIKKGLEDMMDVEEPSNINKTKIPSNIGIKSKEEEESRKNKYKKELIWYISNVINCKKIRQNKI